MSARPRISMPRQARRGEVIEIRCIAPHSMETGFRRTERGALIPRDIVTLFVCSYNGVEVFRAELYPSIAANPYLAFSTVATESGTLEFRWSGDNGFALTETATLQVV